MNVQMLIDAVISSEHSSFYRELWGDSRIFGELPVMTRRGFETPLSERRYKDESSLVKIVHSEPAFLSEWSFSDIGVERFGLPSQRPLVYMMDAYEAIEKSMWCYEQGVVPLIGEKDPEIAMYAAGKYEVDSLITDPEALLKLRPYLESHRLASISVIGESFDTAALASFAAFADTLRLVLALPETGALAEATFAEVPVFTPLPDVVIEDGEHGLIVTKSRLLMTPIIRYQTSLDRAYGAR